MDGNKTESGGWVFLSHSHQDVRTVRKIRNKFEELGFEPLMFYLKCLSDKDEIEELIKREINERDWFVYLDSPNARKSTWVKTEREYIETLNDKNVFTIDLNLDIATQFDLVRHITNQMKVYISYHHLDNKLCDIIKCKLLSKDMKVLSNEISKYGQIENTNLNIKDACHSGFVILLITENAYKSQSVLNEINLTIKEHGKLIPVYIGNASLPQEWLPLIGTIQGVHLSEKPTEEEFDNLIASILNRVEYYSSDFHFSCGFLSATKIELPPISIIDDFTFDECVNLKEVFIPTSVISITKNAFCNQPNILVKCNKGSYAEQYCIANNINYLLTE